MTQDLDVVNRPIERFTVRERDNGRQDHTYYGSPCTVVGGPCSPVVGVITDKDSGKPIAGAKIEILHMVGANRQHMRDRTFTSDANGRYRVTGMAKTAPFGNPHLLVRPPNGEPYPETTRNVPTADGTAPIPFDVAMKRGIPLTVKVIDKQTGRPVKANCEYYPHRDNPFVAQYPGDLHALFLSKPAAAESKYVALPGRGVVTAYVSIGPYRYGVVPDSLADSVSNGQFSTSRAGFPVENFNSVVEINIKPDAKSAEVTIALDPGLSVLGNIVGPDGQEIAGATVIGTNPNMFQFEPVSSAKFEVRGLQAGDKRRVIVVHPEKKWAGKRDCGRRAERTRSGKTGTVGRGHRSIRGRIRQADGGVALRIQTPMRHVIRISLRERRRFCHRDRESKSATTGDFGFAVLRSG